jgi:polyisoprenoid-binding protein YceI
VANTDVTNTEWTLAPPDGELLVRTAVTGRAARLGHRLSIEMTSWQATVRWTGGEPAAVELAIEVRLLQVLRGDGGVKSLSAPEKALVRSNALNCLDAKRFPQIRFHADDITRSGDGYRLVGALEIRGRASERVINVRVDDLGDSWRISGDSAVRQSEFGIKAYSMFMGAMKVADEVTVSFVAQSAKNQS